MQTRYILTLACADVRGIVAAVTGFLAAQEGFIIASAQFGDADTQQFFMRVEFDAPLAQEKLEAAFAAQVAQKFGMHWQLHNKAHRPRMLVLVSKIGHCLNDILYRWRTGQLAVEIPAVASNHEDFRGIVEWHGIPFHYLGKEKAAQEQAMRTLLETHSIELVALARYMQVLPPELCAQLRGRAINIHHSFLPSFKGAKPYHQAHAKGVKLIGATAHYITTDLDEGPIIEQEVARVEHGHTVEDLTAIGRDIECITLARALKLHVERRVLVNDGKTVVFR